MAANVLPKNQKDPLAFQEFSQTFAAKGVPASIWQPIVAAESGGNVNAVGDGGTSFGLLQLHTPGGQGSSWRQYSSELNSVAQSDPTNASVLTNKSLPPQERILLTPAINAQIGSGPIATAYNEGVSQGLTGQSLLNYTAANSGHPYSTGIPSGASTSEQKAIDQYAAQGIGTTKNITFYDGTPSPTNPIVSTTSSGSAGSTGPYSGIAGMWWQLNQWETDSSGPSFALVTIPISLFTRLIIVGIGILVLYVGVKSIISPAAAIQALAMVE